MPALPEAHENTLRLLMNVLMIEVRAERTFSFYEAVISTPGLFPVPDADRDLALELVDRIRSDEAIHVAYLQTLVSEFRSLRIEGVDGVRHRGADIIDPVWDRMVRWHGQESHVANRPAQEAALAALIESHPDAARIAAAFRAETPS